MIFGAILAGGVGSRMKIADIPKQFLPLGDKPIIIHTLEKFIICSKFHKIYIGVHPQWLSYMNDLVERYIDSRDKERVCIIVGGKDRNSTIFNIIEGIENDYEINDGDIIVTHDAVRPFVTLRILNDNIDAASKYGACDTVVNATDTIVESLDDKSISNIPPRNYMYQGQTPQSFNISKLKLIYNDLSQNDKEVLTDACNIFVKRDQYVHLVKGEVSNMKITTVNDYEVVQAMIGGTKND
ncbi:2-C-methyl-D-erythritol 4-phosphate cytidylyltransferase [Clostridium botulinum]|uniref:Ribitol-5-phosphate cytidylyltransferase n=1 Tax=Clostridium botulinum TaxID=1491 RepID=A0A9Q1UZ21_CLOBO|nr:2-C-methyl-D-erythritol 4-phosphate cytidylyltransferase [Clostridium botulinum]AEB75389.1 2-C-methyl-D-erythritol 4-phosphate cytidylyltransferase [Clostridium botulinum BKT015925]KEH99906.1 2-C-methyl-D-erythritol 4-phosphate cytidylyltransferase [Clostridium botulinum D str. 16868]KEI03774.1 2-C-methyl-D-erythritol 4-phosphate cytidylyltransferase [Clostridium botulinum C/D str. Sp77]KLU76354.1 2-C-methyl-D-erythritol 4-phosphate cytidylyltransferase [Clostridium botulinum V891]KOA73642.